MWTVGVYEETRHFLQFARRRLSLYNLSLLPLERGGRYDAIAVLAEGCPAASADIAVFPGTLPVGPELRFRSAVTYGMAEKDTVTLSSVSEDSVVVSVRRDIVSLVGTVVERQDVPLPWKTPPESGLPLASLMLISGIFA